MWEYNHTDELYHYGVKGMKWGVRRYRKNPGSYTSKSLKKFDQSSEKYDSAKQKLKESKNARDRSQIKSDRKALKSAKSQLKKDYKQVRMDNLADQGKALYQKGRTIGDNTLRNRATQAAIVAGSIIADRMLSTYGNSQVAQIASKAIAAGGTAANLMLAAKTHSDNKKLRAYYAHGR